MFLRKAVKAKLLVRIPVIIWSQYSVQMAISLCIGSATAPLLRIRNGQNNPGLYSIPASGGKPSLITKNGTAPQFGSTNDRVYFLRTEDQKPSIQPKRMLISIDLDGSDERTHVISESALEFQISPDEKWLAFLEYFHAYITPFVRTGSTIEIGPNLKSIPIAKVTHDAGEYLHWSGDSKKLHWALGPELYTRELKDAFSFLEGAPEKLPGPVPKKVFKLDFNNRAIFLPEKLRWSALVSSQCAVMRCLKMERS